MLRDRLPLTTFVLLVVTAQLCCSPSTADAEPRKVDRKVKGPVVIDDEFFQPWLLSKGTDKKAKEGYKAFADGRLHDARKALTDYLGRAKKSDDDQVKARFLLAYIEDDSGRDAESVPLYLTVAESWPLLADYARYYAARAAYAAGDYPTTIKACLDVDMGSPFGPRSKYLRGVALLKLGEVTHAAAVMEEYVAKFPRSTLLPEVKLDLALAYEEQRRWADAAEVYQWLRLRYPGGSVETRADAGVKRVRAKLAKKQRVELLTESPKDRVLRAQALHDRHRSETVIKEMTDLLGAKRPPRAGSRTWCDAVWLRAHANTKLRDHDEAARHYKSFIKDCPKDQRTIKAYFSAGRGLWTKGHNKEALAMFERIWTDYPNHSYADDAMLYAARIRREQKEERTYKQLLERQVKTFPRGDMLGDAHWHLFLSHYEDGRYDQAIRYTESLRGQYGENDLYTRGRLDYFTARARSHKADKKAALDGFEDVATRFPMSYYGLLALNRMRELDEARFKKAVKRLARDDGARSEWIIEPPQVGDDVNFRRGIALLRLGLFGEAKQEFATLRRRYPHNDRLLWILTLLFDRAGAYHLSHDIPRRQIASFGTAYPVGDNLPLFELAYPRPFGPHVSRWAKKRKLDRALVYAIMREESGFNPKIESWANAYGLMQLMLPTARDMASDDRMKGARRLPANRLFDPSTNIRLGSRFLQTLADNYDSHPSVTIAGYNGGVGNVDRWLEERGNLPFDLWVEEIPYGQTRDYTKRVTQSFWIYRWLTRLDDKKTDATEHVVVIPNKLPKPSR